MGILGKPRCNSASCARRPASSSARRVLEQRALLGRHGLGPGAELPALQASEFEVDLLQLGIAPSDLSGLVLDLLLQARDQLGCLGWQPSDIDVGGNDFAGHAGMLPESERVVHRQIRCQRIGHSVGGLSGPAEDAEFTQTSPG